MNLRYIFLSIIATLLLSACEQFGIEVTTVKGKWMSERTNGQYISLEISDDGHYSSETILNDTTQLVRHHGVWILKNDTLCLYRQDIKGNGLRKLFVEQLSMNTVTLRNVENNKMFVLNRCYSTQNNDYDSHFEEVFNLKNGFWWYAWQIIIVALSVLFLTVFI